MKPTAAVALAGLLALIALPACDTDAPADTAPDARAASASASTSPGAGAAAAGAGVVAATADGIAAVDPWARVAIMPEPPAEGPAPPVNSAAYLVLRNGTADADALLAVETPVADTAEIHNVTMDDGVMRMRAVDSVAVPAGGQTALEPGGFHVMLIGLRKPLQEGDSVPLTLRLRSGRTLQLTAPVRRGPVR